MIDYVERNEVLEVLHRYAGTLADDKCRAAVEDACRAVKSMVLLESVDAVPLPFINKFLASDRAFIKAREEEHGWLFTKEALADLELDAAVERVGYVAEMLCAWYEEREDKT